MASFEQTYPSITRCVKDFGWIEVGDDGMRRPWVRVLDEGGLIWEDGNPSKPIDESLKTLESAIEVHIREELRR